MGVYFERYVRVHRARVSNEESSRRVIPAHRTPDRVRDLPGAHRLVYH